MPAPSAMSAEAFVVIDGVARVTMRVSSASLQAPATASLFASPLYVATQRYVPALSSA